MRLPPRDTGSTSRVRTRGQSRYDVCIYVAPAADSRPREGGTPSLDRSWRSAKLKTRLRRRVPAFSRLCTYTTFRPTSRLAQGRCRRRAAESTAARRSTNQIHPSAALPSVGCLAVRFRSHPLRPSRVRPRSGEPDDAIGHAATHPVFLPASDGPSDVPGCGDGAYAMQEYPNRRGSDLSEQNCGLATKRGVGNWSAVMKRSATR